MNLQTTFATRSVARQTRTHAAERRAPMRSRRTYQAMLTIILTVPVALLSQVVWANGAGALIHFGLAAGMFLLAAGTADFKTARWAQQVGSISAVLVGTVFLSQGIYEATQISALKDVVYGAFGGEVESLLLYGVIVWATNLVLTDSKGKSKLFGIFSLALIVSAEVFAKAMSIAGNESPEILKVLYLLVLPWLLIEGKKLVASSAADGS